MVRLDVDLRLLREMHPLLPATTAVEYAFRAGLALERRGHASGVELAVAHEEEVEQAMPMVWDSSLDDALMQLDAIRVTEDGAEAVALVLANVLRGWVVRRRLQRGESADWLLAGPGESLVALEVSGIDGAADSGRMDEKLAQVAKATICTQRYACVVAFERPSAALVSAS